MDVGVNVRVSVPVRVAPGVAVMAAVPGSVPSSPAATVCWARPGALVGMGAPEQPCPVIVHSRFCWS